jgi:hypothetical protein
MGLRRWSLRTCSEDWIASSDGVVRVSGEDRVGGDGGPDRVQEGRVVLGIDHIGSAHDEGQLAMLLETARAQLNAGQQLLPIEDDGPIGGRPIGEPVVEGTASLIVWETLAAVYASLGFDQIADSAFKALVLARIIEPTSKADTVRVLAELGVPGPTRVTFMRCLIGEVSRVRLGRMPGRGFSVVLGDGLVAVPV